jgi:hypothetical protein
MKPGFSIELVHLEFLRQFSQEFNFFLDIYVYSIFCHSQAA